MILTVTLHPAIDLLVELDRLDPNVVLRAESASRLAAGKGVNVARMTAHLGEVAHAIVVAGRDSAAEYAMLAGAPRLSVELLTVPGPTRINIGLHEGASGRHYKINTPGGQVGTEVVEGIERAIAGASMAGRAVVLAGSLPPGLVPADLARLVEAGRLARLPVFVDAEGESLRAALEAGPTAAKANLGEWARALGLEAPDAEAMLRAIRTRLGASAPSVLVVTDGAHGAALADESGLWRAKPTATVARRSVGAGDAFLAALVVGWTKGERGADLMAAAVAAAESVAHHQRGVLPPLDEIACRRRAVDVEALGT